MVHRRLLDAEAGDMIIFASGCNVSDSKTLLILFEAKCRRHCR
jgi:hypothetical protein